MGALFFVDEVGLQAYRRSITTKEKNIPDRTWLFRNGKEEKHFISLWRFAAVYCSLNPVVSFKIYNISSGREGNIFWEIMVIGKAGD